MKMNFKIKILQLVAALLIAVFMVSASAASAQSGQIEGIAAIVNDQAITISDVNDRMKLVLTSSG